MNAQNYAIGGANGLVIAVPFGVAIGVAMGNWWFVGLCAIGFLVGAYVLWEAAAGETQ